MKNINELLNELNPNVNWDKLNYEYPKYNGLVYSSNDAFQASEHLIIINLDKNSVKYYYRGFLQQVPIYLKNQLLNAAKN